MIPELNDCISPSHTARYIETQGQDCLYPRPLKQLRVHDP